VGAIEPFRDQVTQLRGGQIPVCLVVDDVDDSQEIVLRWSPDAGAQGFP
jgi:hypothetical protein